MERYYTVSEIARPIGVTVETIKNWEAEGLIPKASRIGRQKKRIWSNSKAQLIFQFAADNGYSIRTVNK